MTGDDSSLAQSIKARLIRHAHEEGIEPGQVLTRFAVERFLYRLSCSQHAESFVLKGALLLLVWLGEPIRPTRDVDLLGRGNVDPEKLRGIIEEICATETEPDGLVFDRDSMQISPIRPEDAYGGMRATLVAYLGSARLKVQIDVGFGDAISPPPEWLDYPALLSLSRPRLLAYRPETAVAEKVHAAVHLGRRNSRMRDFFDIWVLSNRCSFDAVTLVEAIKATFERRRTPRPEGLPVALSGSFASDEGKQRQWSAFLRKSGVTGAPEEFRMVIADLARFLLPVLDSRAAEDAMGYWSPGGPWHVPDPEEDGEEDLVAG